MLKEVRKKVVGGYLLRSNKMVVYDINEVTIL